MVNFANPLSHGGAAIAISLLKYLKETIPDANLTIMTTREFDVSVYRKTYGVKERFVKHTWFRSKNSTFAALFSSIVPAMSAFISCFSYNLLSKLGLNVSNIYDEYDLILDLSSDSLNEYYGVVYPLFSLFQLELALLCNKKVIVCPASIGPFKNRFLRALTRKVVSKTDLVIAREKTTRDILRDLGIPEDKIHFAADLAFLFEPVSKEESVKIATELGLNLQNVPLIGIAPSSEIYRYCFPEISKGQNKYDEYVKLMAEATDFIIEQYDVDVVFIPHSIFPKEFVKNDKIASQDIYNRMKNKEKVKILLKNYRADEVKGVIGLCDILVSCRMHAAIASTSSGVPVVALTFGHKFHSVLGKMMGQSQYLVKSGSDYSTVLADLKQKVSHLWENRFSVRKQLESKRISVKEQAASSFGLMKEILTEE